MCSQDKEYLLSQIMKICMEQIKPNKELNTKYLADKLNELCPIKRVECEVETDVEDPYNLQVTLHLPPFVPVINEEDGELWYVCTKKDVDLSFTVKDNEVHFSSGDEEVMEFLDYIMEENGEVEVS